MVLTTKRLGLAANRNTPALAPSSVTRQQQPGLASQVINASGTDDAVVNLAYPAYITLLTRIGQSNVVDRRVMPLLLKVEQAIVVQTLQPSPAMGREANTGITHYARGRCRGFALNSRGIRAHAGLRSKYSCPGN